LCYIALGLTTQSLPSHSSDSNSKVFNLVFKNPGETSYLNLFI
jgi:hypothetical protein